eukprot:CAMPEP_0172392726 /NCGR_PEP_ID=MMETSP1061-20121228/8762_1 /TAXON_ID=37318 /ORGANISM="Pseudo-nitzschia pungens, Strain cf. pungens" /LENGTH=666 /DNA_ID=CAMNT_0013123609 /DNA_START=130 /DNA_END=2127 /DNA_ORIENTATION=+
MKRVSSRQRLVSWDDFDATTESPFHEVEDDEESYTSGYETALSQTYHSSIALDRLCDGNDDDIDICNNNSFDIDESDKTAASRTDTRRRKRDRKSLRPSSVSAQRTNACKTVETQDTSAFMLHNTLQTPTIVPAFAWESEKISSPLSSSIGFSGLIDDLHLKLFSFLDLTSLRAVMAVDHHFRDLIVSHDARTSLWMDHCQKLWHLREWNDENKQNHHDHQTFPKFIDNFHLPMAAPPSVTAVSFGDDDVDTTNISLLLSLTTTKFPTCVDQDISKPRMRLSRTIQQTIPEHRRDAEDQLIQFYEDEATGRSLVRYNGHIGQGDRCIRSNFPLPRPSRRVCEIDFAKDTNSSGRNSTSSHHAPLFGHDFHLDPHHPFFFNFLQRCSSKSYKIGGNKSSKPKLSSSKSLSSRPSPEWTPFVVPFVDKSNGSDTVSTLNVTPRFVSYFEVSILKPDENNDNAEFALPSRSPSPRYRSSHIDCVAVGVATNDFQLQSRMPGWDRQSYGYHGDDGGIFHASGGMLKEFGPKYGPGDTVGCGVDYVSKGIFYTLNGRFLGYAWEDIRDSILKKDLYPVVGLDTNCPVHLNWGFSGPFQFDLSKFIQKHEETILATYSLDKCVSPNDDDDDDDDAITAANTTGSANSGKNSGRKVSSLSSSRRHRRGIIRRW